MYELIIFDCDGVLIDSEWLGGEVEAEELHHQGCSITADEYLDIALGITSEAVEAQLLQRYGFLVPPKFWQKADERLMEEFKARLTPIRGVKELIQKLKIPCCVASNSENQRLNLTLNLTGLLPLLEGRIYGREFVKRGKPHPDIFLFAAEQMHASPSKCLVIEDSIHGVHAAQAAGMDVWGFCGGRHYNPLRKEQLKATGIPVLFDDMEAVQKQIANILS